MLVKLLDDDWWKWTEDCDAVGGFVFEDGAAAALPDREATEGRRGWREGDAVIVVEAIQTQQPSPIQYNR